MMHELSERELFEAIHYAKSIDEATGAKIIQQFQVEQASLAQTLFSIFPAFVAEQNQEMAYLFMDLCFDVLCVFQQAFGPLPAQSEMDMDWLERQAVLLDAELQALMTDRPMDEKIRSKLQDRFERRSQEETVQRDLVNFMNAAIEDFASENTSRAPAIKITHESAAIFAKACFGHPSPSKRQKLRGSQCPRRPQPSCFIRWIPGKGHPTSFSQ